jgi:6-pyruvoyltetrahydropterin/6-carboxytetrahydropterin synthase
VTTITRKFEFDAGHRVLGHKGKCRHLHGHRYVAEVTVDAPSLNDLDMVIDFSIVKSLIGDWINDVWDHNILLNENDPLAIISRDMDTRIGEVQNKNIQSYNKQALEIFGGKPPYLMAGNPTAEAIATELFAKAGFLLREAGFPQLRVTNVRVYETPNCWADFDGLVPPPQKDNRPVLKGKDTEQMVARNAIPGDSILTSLPESSVLLMLKKHKKDLEENMMEATVHPAPEGSPKEARCEIRFFDKPESITYREDTETVDSLKERIITRILETHRQGLKIAQTTTLRMMTQFLGGTSQVLNAYPGKVCVALMSPDDVLKAARFSDARIREKKIGMLMAPLPDEICQELKLNGDTTHGVVGIEIVSEEDANRILGGHRETENTEPSA